MKKRTVIAAVTVVVSVGSVVPLPASFATGSTTPHQRAISEAKALLAKAPALDGATETASPPVKRLADPPIRWTFSSTVTRSTFWTINESSDRAYDQLAADVPAGMSQNETGTGSGVSYVVDTPVRLPAGIDDAELVLAVTSTGANRTAIGAYGLAAPEPRRPAAEILPRSTHRVEVSKLAGSKVTRHRLVKGAAARRLAADFNGLRLPPRGGVYNCAGYGGRPRPRTVATFFFHGRKLRASFSPTSCGFIDVSRHGRRLPALLEQGPFIHDLRKLLPRKSQ